MGQNFKRLSVSQQYGFRPAYVRSNNVSTDSTYTYGIYLGAIHLGTMVQSSQEFRRKYWATRSSVRSFTHLLAPPCLLRSRATLHSLIRSLAHSFAHSLACRTVNDSMAILSVFLPILDHSARDKNEMGVRWLSLSTYRRRPSKASLTKPMSRHGRVLL